MYLSTLKHNFWNKTFHLLILIWKNMHSFGRQQAEIANWGTPKLSKLFFFLFSSYLFFFLLMYVNTSHMHVTNNPGVLVCAYIATHIYVRLKLWYSVFS